MAQGVTGGAIEGRVLGSDSTPVEQAVVHLVNGSNGERRQTATTARGRYFIEYVSVGGPYRIEIRAIGYEPAARDSIFLALGQRLTADFALQPAVVQLQEITVTGMGDGRFSSARTGPAQVISDSTIARLPVSHRDYTELALLSPQVTRSPNGGLSFVGQHDRFNSIQIDGTNNNDPFGRSGSGNGTPGWAVGLRAFTPEAVKELQIITAPFDVRYGNFAGGLVNAVTESGSNRVEGSIVGYFEGSDLADADATGSLGSEFSRSELGLTLGAPIIRDRVALFVNAAVSKEVLPQFVRTPGSDTTGGADSAGVGIRYESLVRFRDLLRVYGVEPGTFTAGALRSPSRNLFTKVTAQLGVNSRLGVSHNYGHGNARDETGDRDYGSYSLSSSGSENPETINATRVNWTAAFGARFANELILARVDDRRTCLPNSRFPSVQVEVDNGFVTAGTRESCLGLETGHTTWELTDNLGMAAGNHRLTLGVHGELIDLVDDALMSPAGTWFFDSLGALAQGTPSGYVRTIARASSQVAFRANQIAVYAQDQWVPSPRLTLTAGLRLDVPFVPTLPRQDTSALKLGVNTALTPSGNVLWSPRLGVNYDLSGRGTAVLRGGLGLFAGRPAYQWFRNVYARNGIQRIDCAGDEVPAFTLDPANPPAGCAGPSPPLRRLNYFDPEFRFPRTLKLAVGADLLLPGGVVGTVDLLYTHGVNTFEVVDVNLVEPSGVATGEGGRVMYGTVDSMTGGAEPFRRTEELDALFEIRNGGGTQAFAATAQLQKRFANGTELSAAYTYTRAKDRLSAGEDQPGPNVASTPVNGTLDHRELRTSLWERPHKVTLVATTDLPLGFQLGLVYIGESSEPFTYVVSGDANADGFWGPSEESDDVVYLPKDAGDITLADMSTFAAIDGLIRDVPCLRAQRGRLLERNSCRDPWVHQTQARLAKRFRLADQRVLEVTADLFNVLHFLDGDWGLVRRTQPLADGNVVPLLELTGYDGPNGRGIYEPASVDRRQTDVEASRWRLQLGGTLSF